MPEVALAMSPCTCSHPEFLLYCVDAQVRKVGVPSLPGTQHTQPSGPFFWWLFVMPRFINCPVAGMVMPVCMSAAQYQAWLPQRVCAVRWGCAVAWLRKSPVTPSLALCL
jgi:hypothetical protein